jgi:hypothetical protein
MKHIQLRSDTYHYRRRTPKELERLIPKKTILRSLSKPKKLAKIESLNVKRM